MRKELTLIAKNNEKLPEGWDWSSLGKVANVVAGNPAPQGKQFFKNGTYPFVRVQDMGRLGSQRRLSQTNDYINDKAVKKLKLIPKGSVLFTKSGASTLLNQRAILGSDMYVVSHIAAAIPHDGIKSEWLYYWLKTVDFNYIAHATTLPSLPLSKAREIPVPVAPSNEQKRIVAEIEKQFSRLDEAVDNLKRVKANLKRYKASVLKAAVEGKLTEEWRKKHLDVEPADKLLDRIMVERRKKWEETELAKMKKAGKVPKDDKLKKKYKEPARPSGEDLTQIHIIDIPDSWVFCTADQLTTVVTDGEHITPTRSNKGIFLLSARNIQNGWISFEKVDYISKDVHAKLKQRLTINEGDVLMSCSGSVGRSCVAPKKPEFSLVRSVAVLKPVIENGKFMSYSIQSTLLHVSDTKNSYKTDQIRVTLSPQNCRRKCYEQKAI